VKASPPLVSPRTVVQKRRYARGMEDVERRLTAVALRPPGRLGEACAATLRAGGKRVRPLLTLLCARSDGELGEPVLRAAAAVELLHMATLVHDDVLDRADLRRGRPTVAREHGSAMAVSAGNFLLARAFSELAATGDAVAVAALSSAAVGLSEGEVLQRDQTRLVTLARAEYERRCERKTADLFAVACRLGARLSGACEESVAALAEYGRLIGLAFQVFDDILDCSGSEAETGKRPGADVRDGTITLPLLFALEVQPGLSAPLSREDLDAAQVAAVLRVVNDSGALQRAREVAMRYIEVARDVLDGCPGPVERDLLAQVAAQVVARYS
jgi:geranylgeranyl pyrophosphate synthase